MATAAAAGLVWLLCQFVRWLFACFVCVCVFKRHDAHRTSIYMQISSHSHYLNDEDKNLKQQDKPVANPTVEMVKLRNVPIRNETNYNVERTAHGMKTLSPWVFTNRIQFRRSFSNISHTIIEGKKRMNRTTGCFTSKSVLCEAFRCVRMYSTGASEPSSSSNNSSQNQRQRQHTESFKWARQWDIISGAHSFICATNYDCKSSSCAHTRSRHTIWL